MDWHVYLMRIMSIAKVGQKYSQDPYALANYQELEELSLEMINNFVAPKYSENLFQRDIYPTPNVSVRCLVIQDNKILMVKEKDDLGWALPGGWCEIFLSPQDNAIKEVREETGYQVEIKRFLAIYQREKYKNYPTLVSEYALYFLAEIVGGSPINNHEVSAVDFFDFENLPNLSRKTTLEEISQAYRVYQENLNCYYE